MPTKPKTEVKPAFTQEEAKELAEMLLNHRAVLSSVGNIDKAARCEALRARVVGASGKVPGG
jgi:hypothetical protein